MKLSLPVLLVLACLLALPVSAKGVKKSANPRWGKVSNAQIVGPSGDRQPEAPGNPPATLPIAPTVETALQCPRAQVVFRNASRSVLTLRVADAPAVQVAPGQLQRLCAETDFVAWQVQAVAGWQYGGRLDLTGLRLREETLIEPGATLVAVNATSEPQRLQLDGRDAGKLAAGQTQTFGPLLPGQHKLLAQGQYSRRKEPRIVRLKAGETATLTWQPAPTWTRIQNVETEPAHVLIDGVTYGDVAAGGEIRVVGLGPGKHQALLTFVPSGQQKKLTVVATAAGEPAGPSPEIEVTVVNATGELLDVPPGLPNWGTVLDVLATLRVHVPRKTFGATLVGRDSGLKYHLDVHAKRSPDALVWKVTRPEATLRVRNATGLPVTVTLPEERTLAVAANATVRVTVPAGRAKVVARAATGQSWARGLTLQTGRELLWTVKSPQTGVIVTSAYAEPVLLRVDGTAHWKLLPGKSVRFNTRPGSHRLEARAPRSGTQAVLEFDVVDGDRRTLTLKPPTGALHVRAGADALSVRVRGMEVAEVAPGEAAVVPVAAGQVQAEVRDGQGRGQPFLGLVAPTQQVDVAAPAADRTSLEIAWQGPAVAQVAVDGGKVQEVQPGATLKLDGVKRGAHLVALTSGGVSWRRWTQVDGRQPVTKLAFKPVP